MTGTKDNLKFIIKSNVNASNKNWYLFISYNSLSIQNHVNILCLTISLRKESMRVSSKPSLIMVNKY